MSKSMSRIGAITLVVAAGVGIIVQVMLGVLASNRPTTNPGVIVAGWVDMPVGLLLVVALPVLVARIATRFGLLGAVGFALLALSFLVYDVILGSERAISSPYLVTHHVDLSQGPPIGEIFLLLAGGIAKMIGGVLLGIAMLRSGPAWRVAGGLVIASSVVFAAGLIPFVGEYADTVGGIMLLVGLGIAGLQLLGVWAPIARTSNSQQADTQMGAAG
jgi:hypothetical protein